MSCGNSVPLPRAGRLLLLVSCMLGLAASTFQSRTMLESVDWKKIPGRQLLTNAGPGIQYQRVLSRRERAAKHTSDTHVALRKLSRSLKEESFIVKVRQDKRAQVLKSLREALKHESGSSITYLPHDSFVVVVAEHIAVELADLDGVQSVFLLPPEMKMSPTLLDEVIEEDKPNLSRRSEPNSIPTFEFERRNALQPAGTQASSSVGELSVTVGRNSLHEGFEAAWMHGLASAGLGAMVMQVTDKGDGHVMVKVHGGHTALASVAKWLIHQGEVMFVERRVTATAFRIERSASLAERQPAEVRNANAIPRLLGTTDAGDPLVWSQGLRGEGQVIALGDSGLDFDNCAFSDGSGDDLSSIPVCRGQRDCTNPGRHRKVWSYRIWENNTLGDAVNGHGTHVAGSAVANTLDAASPFQMQGSAPEAKVAFEDAQGVPQTPEEAQALFFPFPIRNMFAPSIAAQIKIHSDSWGFSGVPQYTSSAQDVDSVTYANDDYLVVFAAGNEGAQGYSSVTSPAVAKNAIAVGAAENEEEVYESFAKDAFLRIDAPALYAGFELVLGGANFGPLAAEFELSERQLVWAQSAGASPSLACSAVTNAAAVRGNIALIRRGSCSFEHKCFNAQQAGAAACLIANNVDQPAPLRLGAAGAFVVTIPAFSISRSNGDSFVGILDFYDEVLVTLPIFERYGPDNVASFSSRGTVDGRIKPDIVAIGDLILSARSDDNLDSNQCSASTAATFNSGTSMATPLVSGAAALVRQYFEEGFHVSGAKDASQGFSPSAALVKAVILHSGQRMAFPKAPFWSADKDMFPNFDQGHGMLDLSSTLWFGAATSAHQLFFVDRQEMAHGEQWALCLAGVDSSQPLKVTLQWTDPPASRSSFMVLVNDLDLSVAHTPSAATRFGNAIPGRTADGAPLPVLDQVNNNEQVTWPAPPAGDYQVRVTARDLAWAQNFSAVVTGSFASAALCASQQPRCPGGGVCSGHGTCLASGVCRCDPSHAGADCAAESPQLRSGAEVTTPLIPVTGWSYYSFVVPAGEEWSLAAQSLDDTLRSDPDLYLAFERVPSFDDFDALDAAGPSVTSFALSSATDLVASVGAGGGRWVLGVHAWCCSAAQIRLTVTVTGSTTPSEPEPTTSAAPTTSSSTTAAPTTTVEPTTSPQEPTTSSTTTPEPTTSSSTTPEPTTSSSSTPAPPTTSSTTEAPTTTPEPTLPPSTTPAACEALLGAAHECNLMVRNNLKLSNKVVQGKLCVGGIFRASNGLVVGSKLPAEEQCPADQYSLVVGGDVRWKKGTKERWAHCVGGSNVFQRTTGPLVASDCPGDREEDEQGCRDLIDFELEFERLNALSSELAAQPEGFARSEAQVNGEEVLIDVDDSEPFHVVSLDASLLAAGSLRIEAYFRVELLVINLENVPQGGLLIGAQLDYPKWFGNRLLFNHAGTRPLGLAPEVKLIASLLAPNARLLPESAGVLSGQAVVKAYSVADGAASTRFSLMPLNQVSRCEVEERRAAGSLARASLEAVAQPEAANHPAPAAAREAGGGDAVAWVVLVLVPVAALCLAVGLLALHRRRQRAAAAAAAPPLHKSSADVVLVNLHAQLSSSLAPAAAAPSGPELRSSEPHSHQARMVAAMV